MNLIERLEAATGPDRELDAEIGAAVRYHPYGPDHWIGKADIEFRATGYDIQMFRDTGESCDRTRPPAYTSSIDAALTLVPDGLRWSCGFSEHVPHNAQVWTGTGFFEGECDSSRAIAICIAALKARGVLLGRDT